MKSILALVAVLAAAALTAPGTASAYGYETLCYYANGVLRCDRQALGPRSYTGNHKWCMYRSGMLGDAALCSYPSYRECIGMRGIQGGQCIINPDYAEGLMPPPPAARGASGNGRR